MLTPMLTGLGAIPFAIPEAFAAQHAAGQLIRYGALLKDAQTGQIVAHLQETGLLQSVLGTVVSGAASPLSAVTGAVGVVQNEVMRRKLNVLQEMMGQMQVLQIASLATSVVGIGVTVASTAIMLHRMNGLDARMSELGTAVADLPELLSENRLREILGSVRTSLQRVEEAEVSRNPEPIYERAEEALHHGFDKLSDGLVDTLEKDRGDPALTEALVAALAATGGAQINVLFRLDDPRRARMRSEHVADRLGAVYRAAVGSSSVAGDLVPFLQEERRRVASVPLLASELERRQISPRGYFEQAAAEEEQPLLLLPSTV